MSRKGQVQCTNWIYKEGHDPNAWEPRECYSEIVKCRRLAEYKTPRGWPECAVCHGDRKHHGTTMYFVSDIAREKEGASDDK